MNHSEATATPANFNPADFNAADFNPADFKPADFNWGRKGVAFDWQSLYLTAATADLDREFAAFAPVGATDAG